MPGGQAFDKLFDAWALDTTIADRCFCQIIMKLYDCGGSQSHTIGVLVFENFSEGIMISEHARIQILTLRVCWK